MSELPALLALALMMGPAVFFIGRVAWLALAPRRPAGRDRVGPEA